jgi:hypothetical protein
MFRGCNPPAFAILDICSISFEHSLYLNIFLIFVIKDRRFTFKAKHMYWLFDPEDFSYSFRLEKLSMNVCGDADVKLGYNKEQNSLVL